jgi:eukaryotic-like serine/threonine-protein kinase
MPLNKSLSPQHSRAGASTYHANMTWATRSVSRTLKTTGVFLRQQIWLWPIIAVVLLATLGLFVRFAIERTMKASLVSELQTLRDVEVAMLRTWLSSQEQNAESLANATAIRQLTTKLLEGNDPEAAQALTDAIAPGMSSHGYDAFFILDDQKIIRAATNPGAVGREDLTDDPVIDDFFTRALDGTPTVCRRADPRRESASCRRARPAFPSREGLQPRA